MKKYFSNSKGVSLITLVITIIVIIILAAIVLFTSLTTVDNANYATFVSEYDEINSGTQAQLKSNILNGKSEEERNAGFTKVKVENAPGSFVSVSDDAISGYVINLDTIKVTGTKTGKGEVINETVTFGKDDIYIYDDEGKVYYAKGYSDGSGELKYRLEENENLATKPTIENVSFDLSSDESSAVITVVAKPGNGGELTVTGGGKTAVKTAENTYEIEVSQNGTVTIIIREDGGGSATETIEIAGITKPKYTITYNLNGGTSSTEIASQTVEIGTSAQITTVTPIKTGYQFLGWAEEKEATEATYRAGGIYSKGISITLYAVWKSKMLPTIPTVTMADYTYGQTPSTPQISANPGNGTVTYYYNTSNSVTGGTAWSSSKTLDVGTYYMYAKITNMKDYDDTMTGTTSFTVKQASGSVSWAKSSVEVTFGNTNFENKLSKIGDGAVTFISTKESVATVDTNGNVTVKGAGTTTIKATVADSKNYAYSNKVASYELTVNKGNITAVSVSMKDYTYEQTPSTPTVTGNTNGGTVTYYYSSSSSNSEGTVWSGITSTSLNAGTYYIYAVIAETDNYNAFTTSATSFTISKSNTGSISFSESTVTKTTNDEYFTNTINNTGDGKVSYASSNTSVATVDKDGKVTIIDEGETTITATVANGTNYTYTSANSTNYTYTSANSTASYTLKVEVPVYYLMERDYTSVNWHYNSTDNVIGNNGYSASDIKTITIQNNKNVPENCITSWDVSYYSDGSITAWLMYNSEEDLIYDLYIGANIGTKGKIMLPKNSEGLFIAYRNCTEINGIEYLDTSNTTDMSYMFYNCYKLEQLDLSTFNTSNVTNMEYMFGNCAELAELNVSNFNTVNVTNMHCMFSDYDNYFSGIAATELDLSSFDTSSVTDMGYMFNDCSRLIKLDISNFRTGSVTDMSYMFSECEDLKSIDVTKFDTTKVTNMSGMFNDCKSLESIDVTKFDTTKVTNMNSMFSNCDLLTNINVVSFDTSSVIDMASMFSYCQNLISVDVRKFDTSKVTDMSSMFCYCRKLESLNLDNFITTNVTEMTYMFCDCSNLTSLDVSNFDTSNVTSMYSMFEGCSNLTDLNLSNFNTSKVTQMYRMFYNCSKLTNLNLDGFNTSSVTNMSYMFYNCSKLKALVCGKNFGVLYYPNMFYKCSNLITIISFNPEPIRLGDSTTLNNNCILYVSDNTSELAYEIAYKYYNIFGNTSKDTIRDDGSTDIYRIRTIMELVGDSEVSIEIGDTYSEQGVTVAGMNANDDGTYTAFGYTVSSSIKDRSGNVVSEIDTSRAGTYTVTYKLSNASGEVEGAEVSRTVKVTMIHSVANGPVLNTSEMKAVYWNESGDEFETTSFALAQTEEGTIYNTTLYNYNYSFDDDIYELGTDTYEVDWVVQPRWANAKTTSDSSYWVWIPRYAYKITYYTGSDKKTVSSEKTQYGSIDIIFLKDKSNNEYIDKNGNTQTLPKGYIVHPAFQAMSEEEATEGNRLGKWDEELTGIWVAKYEASNENGKIVSKPSVTSWRNIAISDVYQNCLNINTSLSTHQMKNSEWGAVAYLTYSVYGRNGNELAVNQCSSYYTGGGPGKGDSKIYNSTYAYDENTFSGEYAYNTVQGKLASTTGNIYGIYDMSGGAFERIASYIDNGHDNLNTFGSNLVNSTVLKYTQVYKSTVKDESDEQKSNYNENAGIYGDAVYETSTMPNSNNSWCNDYSDFSYSGNSFSGRGGYYNNTNSAGVFGFTSSYGGGYSDGGFRPVICISSSK